MKSAILSVCTVLAVTLASAGHAQTDANAQHVVAALKLLQAVQLGDSARARGLVGLLERGTHADPPGQAVSMETFIADVKTCALTDVKLGGTGMKTASWACGETRFDDSKASPCGAGICVKSQMAALWYEQQKLQIRYWPIFKRAAPALMVRPLPPPLP